MQTYGQLFDSDAIFLFMTFKTKKNMTCLTHVGALQQKNNWPKKVSRKLNCPRFKFVHLLVAVACARVSQPTRTPRN